MRLTADHPVRRVTRKTRYLIESAWAKAGDLRAGDEIVLQRPSRGCAGWDGAHSEAEGYLLGLLIGDGTLKTDKAVLSVWAPELRLVAVRRVPIGGRSRAAASCGRAEAAAATLPHRS